MMHRTHVTNQSEVTLGADMGLRPRDGYCVPVSAALMVADDPTDLAEVVEWFKVTLEGLRSRMKRGTFYGGSQMCRAVADLLHLTGTIDRIDRDDSKVGFRGAGDGWGGARYMSRTGYPTCAQWARTVPDHTPVGTRYLLHGTGHAGVAIVTPRGLVIYNMGARHRIDHTMRMDP